MWARIEKELYYRLEMELYYRIEVELYCRINQKNASLCQEYANHLGLWGGGGGPEDLGGGVFQVLKTLKKRLGSLMLKLQYDQKRQWGQPDQVSVRDCCSNQA
jgi:hypothetical protein